MNIQSIVRKLLSVFLVMNIVKEYKSKTSLMRIKAARIYVGSVKKTRIFFIGMLGAFISLFLLINGVSLIQAAFFDYSMLSVEMKFIIALLLGIAESLAAIVFFIFLLSEETWSKFAQVQHVINKALEEQEK